MSERKSFKLDQPLTKKSLVDGIKQVIIIIIVMILVRAIV